MALFDDGSTGSLEDVLGQQATNAVNSIENQYAKKRRQSIAQAGATGRLRSGVYNYTAGDLNAQEAGDIGNVQSSLAAQLGQIPIGDYAQTQDNARKRELAQLLASINSPSALEEALGGLSAAIRIAGTVAAFKGG